MFWGGGRSNYLATSKGFTLLEVLVALAIMGISLTVLFTIFSQCIERTREDTRRLEARNLSQSLLSQALKLPPEKMANATGETADGLRWQVKLANYGSDADWSAWQSAPKAVIVSVRWISYGNERSMTLTSLRLLPRE